MSAYLPLTIAQVEAQPSSGSTPTGAANTGAAAPANTGTATGANGGVATTAPANQPASPLSSPFFLIMIAVAFFVVFILPMRQQRKERKKMEEMLSSIKKGDRVRMAGGILGSIVEVRDDEVVVKVDESSNTKIRFARQAVERVIDNKSDPAEASTKAETSK